MLKLFFRLFSSSPKPKKTEELIEEILNKFYTENIFSDKDLDNLRKSLNIK